MTRFLFGVRAKEDVFYQDMLENIVKDCPDFSFDQYLSRDELPGCTKGYVTDFLDHPEQVRLFQEFYICGSPAMVKDARMKLEALGIPKEAIKFEQY